jgi:hypothetical protein
MGAIDWRVLRLRLAIQPADAGSFRTNQTFRRICLAEHGAIATIVAARNDMDEKLR